MLTSEWNMDIAVKVAQEEGAQKNARAMKAKGMDVSTIAEITELTVDEILRL